MVIWIRKLLLLVAMLVLPLQAFAMGATFVKCHEQASAQLAGQSHEHGEDSGATHHDGQNDDGGAPSGFANHLCGHHFVMHPPAPVNVVTAPDFAVWTLPAFSSYAPHYPEQPRRPPRV